MGWLVLSHLGAAVLGALALAVISCLCISSKVMDGRDEEGVDGY
jgi:hypothetical protein